MSAPGASSWLLSRALVYGCCLLACGCAGIGPSTIPRDRFDYVSSMNESWKRQALINIVRLRYLEPPSFVDVGQIVAGYSLETGIGAGGQLARTGAGDTFVRADGHAVFTDRPTITYTPLTGRRFVHGLMTPIPPESLLYTIESGWPADLILATGIVAMNGLRNEHLSVGAYQPPDPGFVRVVQLLRRIQDSGAISMRIIQDGGRTSRIIAFPSRTMTAETQADIAECRQLLGLNQQTNEFEVVFGVNAANDRQIALQTRTLLHVLGGMAARVEVPPEDVRAERAAPDIGVTEAGFAANPRIHFSKEEPADVFVAVPYRGGWFWVDDKDLRSKRAFSLVMLFFTLSESGEKEDLPLITIPAQ